MEEGILRFYEAYFPEVKTGDYRSCYLLMGEEFQRSEALSYLLQHLLEPSLRDFNLDIFNAENLSLETFAEAISSFPLMSPRRVVVINDCDKLKDSTLNELMGLISHLNNSTVLILVGDKFDLRKSFFAWCKRSGTVVEFKTLYENQIPAWILNRVRGYGKRISLDAIQFLIASVGVVPRELANELEKLIIFVGNKETINGKDAKEVVGFSRSVSIFDLCNAVGERKSVVAFAALNTMFREGEKPTEIVRMLARHFMILLKLKNIQEEQIPADSLPSRLGIAPFFLKEYIGQSKNFNLASLQTGLDLLLKADNQLKSGAVDEKIALQVLLYKLCRQ